LLKKNSKLFKLECRKLTSWLLLLTICVLGLLGVLVWVVLGSASCDRLRDCDAFESICAVYETEHQFFYSECDLERENCLTGKKWKRDHFTHCNVYSL
ncbi:uncharacterized protein LOC119666793, partial [Teleopsis dalmanni]|uniref:uncharacterized protein LOC119666793 n=1 Tax=Teleopsis dalmanni TaxID=139649 RepID=UPI0018CD9360